MKLTVLCALICCIGSSGCSKGEDQSATSSRPAPQASKVHPPTQDRSSPTALVESVRASVVAWDLRELFNNFDSSSDESNFEEFSREFTAGKAEIVECLQEATLGETEEVEAGEEAGARTIRFALVGCPSKHGLTGRMIQRSDGSWRILKM